MKFEEFQVDEESRKGAEAMTLKLHDLYEVMSTFRDWRLHHSPRYFVSEYIRRKHIQGTPSDLVQDVSDFSVVVSLCSLHDLELPMLRLGDADLIPILPPTDRVEQMWHAASVGLESDPRNSVFSNLKAGLERFEKDNIETQPASEAQVGFFRGLNVFLATRLAGKAWLRRQAESSGERNPPDLKQRSSLPDSSGASPSSGLPDGVPPSSAVVTTTQRWKIISKAANLNIYYTGVHMCRTNPYYAGAPTTPVDVDLPTGKLYLAANSTTSPGCFKWEMAQLTVPSHKPTYHCQNF